MVKPIEKGRVCPKCNKKFCTPTSARRHMRNVHGLKDYEIEEFRIEIKTVSCPITDCDKKFHLVNEMRFHLAWKHDFDMQIEELIFNNKEEFYEWLENEHKRTCSQFVRKSSTYSKNNECIEKSHYYCNRSGKYQIRENRKRSLKSQGSCKIGFHCPAGLETYINKDKVLVKYYKRHFGHDLDLTHLHLTKPERAKLADALDQGIPHKEILTEIRHVKGSLERQHIITKKDLHNVAQSFGINQNCEKDIKDIQLLKELEEESENESHLDFIENENENSNQDCLPNNDIERSIQECTQNNENDSSIRTKISQNVYKILEFLSSSKEIPSHIANDILKHLTAATQLLKTPNSNQTSDSNISTTSQKKIMPTIKIGKEINPHSETLAEASLIIPTLQINLGDWDHLYSK